MFQNINKFDSANFISQLENFELEYSELGLSDKICGKILLKDFIVNIKKPDYINKYIFHDILKDKNLFNLVIKEIPLPCNFNFKLRISRFYYGENSSGTYIHQHSPALNYLIKGKKLWIMFPNYMQNILFMKNNDLNYYCYVNNNTSKSFINWLDLNLNKLIENIYGLQIFIQNAGEVVYIPNLFYHGVLNIEEFFGVTYSWFI